VDPSGRFVYVTSYDSNEIQAFTINQTTGALTSVGTTNTGVFNYHLTVDPSGRFVYVTSYYSTTVQAFTINQTTGALTSVGATNTGFYTDHLTVDPSGRFVYVTSYYSNTVQAFTINQTTGALTSVGTTNTGSGLRDLTVDPSGRFVYVTSYDSNTVQAFTINQTTGALTSVGTTNTGSGPRDLTVDPSGRFVYVVNSISNTVQAFTINNFGAGSAYFAGNVGIGTSVPARALHVQIGTDAPPVRFQDSSGHCEINPTSTTWTCTSDQRLKKDIQSLPTDENLSKLLSLRPVSFAWNTQTDNKKRYGLISQEVEQYFPEFVNTDENGMKSVSYGSFTTTLIAGIQEQQLQIAGLNSNLTNLSNNFDLKLDDQTGEIVTSINTLTNSTNVISNKANTLEQTLTQLSTNTVPELQASTSASISELNQRLSIIEQFFTGSDSTSSAELLSFLSNLINNQVLGVQSDALTLADLTVTHSAAFNDMAVTGQITSGILAINGFDDTLATPSATISTLGGPLKLQHLSIGDIDFMGGKTVIDTNGNIKIIQGDLEVSTGLIKGNANNRGISSVVAKDTFITDVIFETPRANTDYAVVVTPNWLTDLAVIEKRSDGFKIQFLNIAPAGAKVDWVIID
jgi:DNA-binding beta-propeller fold protein YncE